MNVVFCCCTGQYRKAYSGCREHFEDLQQDLAVIGQIAGLVSTLRRSYRASVLYSEVSLFPATYNRKKHFSFELVVSLEAAFQFLF